MIPLILFIVVLVVVLAVVFWLEKKTITKKDISPYTSYEESQAIRKVIEEKKRILDKDRSRSSFKRAYRDKSGTYIDTYSGQPVDDSQLYLYLILANHHDNPLLTSNHHGPPPDNPASPERDIDTGYSFDHGGSSHDSSSDSSSYDSGSSDSGGSSND